jgi:prepilin-type N-terminal cleavage/methylation domain-containing protein
MIFFSNKQTASFSSRAGFGLIELLVSISIMVLVTSIVLARHSAFSGTVLLKSQAYEIALRLREAQLSAVSVATSTEGIRSQYGARFTAPISNDRYTVFATRIGASGNFYQSGDFSLLGAPGLLDKRFVIKGVNAYCANGSADTVTGGVIVLFKRPNFDADFRDINGGAVSECSGQVSGVGIRIGPVGSLDTATSSERIVTVTKAGQISVD